MRRALFSTLVALALAGPLLGGCASTDLGRMTGTSFASRPPSADEHYGALIASYAAAYRVPESLVHRVIRRESGYNAGARNGPYWGLMQISLPTARTMGFSGAPAELLEPETNLRYAVKYLAGAYLVAGEDEARALSLYRSGYYYDAKRKGLLVATGLASL